MSKIEKCDLFEWMDEQYWCIESNGNTGLVNPVGQTFYIRNFIFSFGEFKSKFIRKANEQELEKLGIKP